VAMANEFGEMDHGVQWYPASRWCRMARIKTASLTSSYS
jgi:hypothetical protein